MGLASYLRRVAATPDAHTDVHVGESGGAQKQHRLVCLLAEDGRLEEIDRAAVNLDHAAAALAVSDGSRGLLLKGWIGWRPGVQRIHNKSCLCANVNAVERHQN